MTPNRVSAIAFRWSISAVFTLCAFAPKAHAQSAANTINGVYNGTYTCAMGPRTLKLSLLASGNGSLTGVFRFYLPPTSHTKAFSYSMNGTFDAASGKFKLSPVKWETPPPGGYSMVGMDGAFNPGTGQVAGKIAYGGCGAFQATRDQAESANTAPAAPVAKPAAAAGRGIPVQAQGQQGKGYWWYCSSGPYMTGVFFYPADITTQADIDAAIRWAWSNYVKSHFAGNLSTGCMLGGADQASTQRIHDHMRAGYKSGAVVDVDWKYVPGQDTVPSQHVGTWLIYCASWTGPDVYVSDKFEVPAYGLGGKSNIMGAFRQFLHEKYSLPIEDGLTPVGCGVDMGVGGAERSITSVEANVENNAKQGKKIVKTGWKYVGTLPPLPPPGSH